MSCSKPDLDKAEVSGTIMSKLKSWLETQKKHAEERRQKKAQKKWTLERASDLEIIRAEALERLVREKGSLEIVVPPCVHEGTFNTTRQPVKIESVARFERLPSSAPSSCCFGVEPFFVWNCSCGELNRRNVDTRTSRLLVSCNQELELTPYDEEYRSLIKTIDQEGWFIDFDVL